MDKLAGAPYPGNGAGRRETWAFAQPIPANEKLVLVAIVTHDFGREPPRPSVARLARMTSLSERRVIAAVTWLRTHGWLAVRRNHLPNGLNRPGFPGGSYV